MPEIERLLQSSTEILPLFEFYSKALSLVVYLCPDIKNNWSETLFLFSKALQEINAHNTIKTTGSEIIPLDVTLPNAWFITPFGDLYNTGSGHKEANLVYSFDEIMSSILDIEFTKERVNKLLTKRLEIIKNGFIDRSDFIVYLNYANSFPSIPHSDGSCEQPRSYNPNLVNTILGVVSAQAGFYSFFEEMQKRTISPEKELEKLLCLTNGQISDIFVRCAGFCKVESSLDKTITTSLATPYEYLFEYLKRGWDVCMIAPIIIDREKGEIKALDLNTLLVERYFEHNTERYEENKESGYGKIYLKAEKRSIISHAKHCD